MIEREEREDTQVDHLVSLLQDDRRKWMQTFTLVPIKPCLSLPAIQSFQYIGDELHRHGAYDPDPYLVGLHCCFYAAITDLLNSMLD